jgi:hypothetical protein
VSLIDEANALVTVKLSKRLQQLDDILKRKGVDLSELEKSSVKSVGFYQMMHKDSDNEAVITDLARIEFAPSWDSGPEWPVIERGPATVKAPKPAKTRKGKWRTAVVLPDMQIGYWWTNEGTLEPTHDEKAIAVARAIIRDVQPDVIVMHGDNADFPELSRYRLTPTFQRTTQATIDRCTVLAADLRADAPHAEIVWLAGNHEERLANYIIDNAKAAFGLRRGLEPEGWPVLSMPHLCRFDDHGVQFLPGYPANTYWINDKLRVIHGNIARKGGVAHHYLDDARVSTLYGHVHRAERAERTRTTREGPRTVIAASAGCLARIDGAVPSTKGGYDLDGQPLVAYEDWQNGLFVVPFQPGDGLFALEHVQILNGWANWRGTEYVA